MTKKILCSALCLLAVLTMGLSSASAADKVDTDPKQQLPKPDGKPADMTKPVQVFILLGQSNMCGLGNVSKLEEAVKKGLYPYLVDDAGKWTERKDVREVYFCKGKLIHDRWMMVGERYFGVEQAIGHILGNIIDAPVLTLKSCDGNKSLGYDLLPPGSEPYDFEGKMQPGYGGTKENPKGDGQKPKGKAAYAGWEYDIDVENAKKVLADLGKYYPGATKYEVAGFFFWQGEKDCGNAAWAQRYELNLVNFIKALRKDFDAPNAKFVLATLGEATKGCGGSGGKVLDAQLAVDGNSGKHPEFKGNVATVYSNPLTKKGRGQTHYGGDAETYMGIGEAMGRAMAELLKK